MVSAILSACTSFYRFLKPLAFLRLSTSFSYVNVFNLKNMSWKWPHLTSCIAAHIAEVVLNCEFVNNTTPFTVKEGNQDEQDLETATFNSSARKFIFRVLSFRQIEI